MKMFFLLLPVLFFVSCSTLQVKNNVSVQRKTVAIETNWSVEQISGALHEWRNLVDYYVDSGFYANSEMDSISISVLSGDDNFNLIVVRHTTISPEIGVLFDLIDYTNIYFPIHSELLGYTKGL